jgi:hypothetical protein
VVYSGVGIFNWYYLGSPKRRHRASGVHLELGGLILYYVVWRAARRAVDRRTPRRALCDSGAYMLALWEREDTEGAPPGRQGTCINTRPTPMGDISGAGEILHVINKWLRLSKKKRGTGIAAHTSYYNVHRCGPATPTPTPSCKSRSSLVALVS